MENQREIIGTVKERQSPTEKEQERSEEDRNRYDSPLFGFVHRSAGTPGAGIGSSLD